MSRSTKPQRLIAFMAVLVIVTALTARHLEIGPRYTQALDWLKRFVPTEDQLPEG